MPWNAKATGERGSETLTSRGREIHMTGYGYADYDAAKAGLVTFASPSFGDLVYDGVEVEDVGGGLWDGVIRYTSASTAGGVGTTVFSFNTSGGTKHIVHSISTSAFGGGPDVKGAIGPPDGDKMVAGVDIVSPQYEFTITKYISDSAIAGFRAVLFAATGKTNADAFYGMQPGECLFRGCEGGKRSGGDWELALHFAGSPNRVGVKIGTMTVAAKGWEYIDVRYEDVSDTNAKALVRQPKYVYVHQVYESAIFAALGV